MELKEAIRRVKEHFAAHDDGRPTPYLDEACTTIYEAIKDLEKLKELQQKGLLIELPCAIGDTVWDIKWWGYYDESVVVDGKTYHRQVCKYKVTKSRFSLMDYNRIGEDVFLTKKEAEEACKKNNGEV